VTEPQDSTGRPETPPPTRPALSPERRWSTGTVVIGVLLVLAGVAWLLEATDAVEVPWETLLPVALIVVGVALLASARRERPRGLIAAGVILTVVSAATGDVGVGGVGDRTYRPTTLAALERVPDLGVGQLELDLRTLDPSVAAQAEEEIDVSVGVGQLVVLLPADLPVQIQATSGIGEVDFPDGSEGGFGAEAEFGDFEQGGDRLVLELSVGIGQVTVDR